MKTLALLAIPLSTALALAMPAAAHSDNFWGNDNFDSPSQGPEDVSPVVVPQKGSKLAPKQARKKGAKGAGKNAGNHETTPGNVQKEVRLPAGTAAQQPGTQIGKASLPAVSGTPVAGACPTGNEQQMADVIAAYKPFSAQTGFLSNQGFLHYCLSYDAHSSKPEYQPGKTKLKWHQINKKVLHFLHQAEYKDKVTVKGAGPSFDGKPFEKAIGQMNRNHRAAMQKERRHQKASPKPRHKKQHAARPHRRHRHPMRHPRRKKPTQS
ncbi:MAG: hypothetical protein KGJ45_08950 [Elusimicrobia bacterium]|nr:hypothetical protein [Elusimicrobiota bacterium]